MKCGHKQEAQFAHFCSSCGESLSSGVAKSSSLEKKSSHKSQVINDDETDASFVPDVEKFEVEVEMPSNVVTISSKDGRVVFESSKFKRRELNIDHD